MTSFTAADARHMARALQLARRGLYTTDPNPRVGCVVVNDGVVVGEGWHERAGEPHAEIIALRAAGDRARGADLYVTLETCCHHGRTPPCTDGVIAAGVRRVVAAMNDPNPLVSGKGTAALQAAGIEVGVGLMQASAEALNPGFISRMQRGRPWVRLKMAASLDGRTALKHGESRWITGEAARRDVQRWRARSSAILTGVGTVLADDPALTVRLVGSGDVQGRTSVAGAPSGDANTAHRMPEATCAPLRVVVDGRLRMPATAQMLRLPGRTLIATTESGGANERALTDAGAEIIRLPSDGERVDLTALLRHLAGIGVNELLVEAGAELCGALLRAALVDEIIVYQAPHIMGDQERSLFHLPPLAAMADRITVTVTDVRAVGDDWRVQALVTSKGP